MPLGEKYYDCSVASQKIRRLTYELRRGKIHDMKKEAKNTTPCLKLDEMSSEKFPRTIADKMLLRYE